MTDYRFRGRLESNAEDPQEVWVCLRCSALVQTQDRDGHRGWHLDQTADTGAHPAVVASDLERLRTAVRCYLDQLRVGHKGKDELDRMRVLVQR